MMILEREGKPCWSIDYSPDGQLLAASYVDELILWDVAGQKERTLFPDAHHESFLRSDFFPQVRFSPRNNDLVVGGWRILRFYSIPEFKRTLTLRSRNRTYFSTPLHFSPNGSLVATSTWPVSVWDLTKGGVERRLLSSLRGYSSEINAIAFLPNDWLVIGANRVNVKQELEGDLRPKQVGTVKIRDPRGSRDCDKVQGPEYPGSILALACSPNGTLIASGVGKKIEIWNLQKRSAHATCRGHRRFIRHLAFTPDGEHLVSSTWDEVKVWHVASGRAVGTYKWEIGKLTSLAMAPDGMTAAVASEEGKIAIWDLDSGS